MRCRVLSHVLKEESRFVSLGKVPHSSSLMFSEDIQPARFRGAGKHAARCAARSRLQGLEKTCKEGCPSIDFLTSEALASRERE